MVPSFASRVAAIWYSAEEKDIDDSEMASPVDRAL